MTAREQIGFLAGISFTKMTGTGNDFILVDNRRAHIPVESMPRLAQAVCCRRRSAGADGLIVLNPPAPGQAQEGVVEIKWDFFNSDGSSAEMCGNGARCAARFARDLGLAGQEMVLHTLAGPIRAKVLQDNLVRIQMVKPSGAYSALELETKSGLVKLQGVNTGVPHAVVFVDDIENAPVRELGRELRFHAHFAPAGTNVNFAVLSGNQLLVRTYERGVEDETLACGTGVVASALMAGAAGMVTSPVDVRVRSGEMLKVYFEQQGGDFDQVFLEGPTSYVYDGVLNREAFDWLLQSGKEQANV